jgi:hypothetical protein
MIQMFVFLSMKQIDVLGNVLLILLKHKKPTVALQYIVRFYFMITRIS